MKWFPWEDRQMDEIRVAYSAVQDMLRRTEDELKRLDIELDDLGRTASSIVVKKIESRLYYYEQWREKDKNRCRLIGSFEPGAAAEAELRIQRRSEAMKEYKRLLELRDVLHKNLQSVEKLIRPELEEIHFEVLWGDELASRVSAKGKRVHVSRYLFHPVKQLFYAEQISRNQLNEVLRLRCFDENRPDKENILSALGLSAYRPLDIVRKTHGVSYNDYIWFRFPGEKLTAKDVLVR